VKLHNGGMNFAVARARDRDYWSKEVRGRIFEVHASDQVVDLFDKLDTVLEFYFSLAKRVRSTEMWRLMLFWSLMSLLLWVDCAEADSELEEVDEIATGNLPEPTSTYH
jgi:hypothetical protein